MRDRMLAERMIGKRDLGMVRVTDDVDDVVRIMASSYAQRRKLRGEEAGAGRETP
jgi:hypothetical protein